MFNYKTKLNFFVHFFFQQLFILTILEGHLYIQTKKIKSSKWMFSKLK